MESEFEQSSELRRIWSVVQRYKWAILTLAGAASLIAALVVFAMTPIYTASATILIESQQSNVVSIEEVYGVDTKNAEYYKTQSEILSSRPIVESVIHSLSLTENSEFNTSQKSSSFRLDWRDWMPFSLGNKTKSITPDPLHEAIDVYYRQLTISPLRNTQLVNVNFDSADPNLAAMVANEHAQAYIKSVLQTRAGVTDTAESWMMERLVGLQESLLESEQRLQAYREQEQLIDDEGLRSLPARQVNELSSRLVEVRTELSQARIAYSQVYQGSDIPLEDLRGIPAILDDKVVQDLQQAEADAQRRVAELAERYGPEHPSMIAAQSELSKASENLRQQHTTVAEVIKNKFEAAQAEEAELVNLLNRAKQQYQDVGRKESNLLALKRESDTNRDLYELFYNRIRETTAAGDLETAPARVVSPAVVPIKPSKPQKRLAVSLVFSLSLIAAVTAAFFFEAMNNTIRSAADVEEKLRLPLLGMIPLLKTRGKKHNPLGNVYFRQTEPGFSEAIRTVRTSISLDNMEHPHKVMVVASSTSGEGKSTVALNLAYAFAQSEKVLLLDADMRRPSIAKSLNAPNDKPGLAELLAGDATLAQCVLRDKKGMMDLLLPGSSPADPSQLLSSERLVNALLVLRRNYDRIIVDTPPILPVSDGLLISIQADAVIFVAKSDSTSTQQINQALDLLLRVNARVTGIVVNKLDVRKAAKYSDYGYGGYYETYEAT